MGMTEKLARMASVLGVGFMLAGGSAGAVPIFVNGVIHGQIIEGDPNRTPHGAGVEAIDLWDGDLAGNGVGHVFGSEPISNGQHGESTATRKLFTADGTLFFVETSQREGGNVVATSVISNGTGMFKGATGTLHLTGSIFPGGRIDWIYSGVIDLAE
jgi:hypothetical protein